MSQIFVDTIRNRDGNGAPVFDKGIVISGIITASGSLAGDSVSIGVTEVVSSSFELKNITGIDSTTTATIESAIANAPNDFTSLNVSGISTFGDDIDLNADIDIFGHTAANTLNAVGILTSYYYQQEQKDLLFVFLQIQLAVQQHLQLILLVLGQTQEQL